ncbi:hypothetical protein GHK92_12580 [Nocardioides sp. dk4132]|nr:hypothetical protein [Nocardioides sp. dk4132]MQW76714.1 hypothetical protein [Nocardioides sp. dk4132]QGA06928.1 hypothetical protein GFH29_05640 [Nocardioides sp. dk884]
MWMEGRWPRALVSLLLAVSGLLAVAGARERWWPACRRGDFDAPRCLARQGDRFDYMALREPWVPVGHAAELAGASYAALALALALLPWLLLRGPRRLVAAASVVLGASLLPLAWLLWASGRAGEVVEVPLLTPLVVGGVLLGPLVLAAVVAASLVPGALRRGPASRLQQRARLLLAVLVVLCGPLGQVAVGLLIAPVLLGYVSHDTTPWTEAVNGGLLVLAALAAWPATGRRRRRTTTSAATEREPSLPVA